MSGIEAFRYDGRRALVVGGATGMGAAAARTVTALGGEVTVMDCAPVEYAVAGSIAVDLRELRQIDAALDRFHGPVHAVFVAAGVADGTAGIMKVNFISHRHIIERLVERGDLAVGGAVCMISSVAGLGWETRLPTILDFLSTTDFGSAVEWVEEHEGTNTYTFSKEAMNCYVASSAYPLSTRGVRINAICPGPTDTPLARANAETWLTFAQDYRNATDNAHLTPNEMADVMTFLNSSAASGVSGVNLLVDQGHVMSSLVGSWQAGTQLVTAMRGR